MSGPSPFGFLNINKRHGITAHDVIDELRRILRVKQIGHAGTLDPLATGVLPVAVGKACRLLRFLPGGKVYLAEILLGRKTTTDDIEGQIISESSDIPDQALVEQTLQSFIGVQQQVPPLYSAIHVGGKRLYQMARDGETPDAIPEREVEVTSVELVSFNAPVAQVRIACGPGTYIRSIARDLGEKLGCGGCLQSLVREQSGPFSLSEARVIPEVSEAVDAGQLNHLLVAPHRVIGIMTVEVDDHQAKLLQQGQPVLVEPPGNDLQRMVAMRGEMMVAVCRTSENVSNFVRIQPEVVIANGEQTN